MINEKPNSDISLILVTKYSSASLALCLDSYFRNSELNHELIVVADNPSWQVLKVLQEKLVDYMLVRTGHFFRNCNIGAEKAIRKYVGFVNDDVVFGPQWDSPLQRFINAYNKPSLISSNLLDSGRNFHFGYDPSKGIETFHLSEFEEYTKKAQSRLDIQSFFWMPLLMPRDIFKKYRGFTTFSSHGHGHEIVLENILKTKEKLNVFTIMASTIYHFGALCNIDDLDSKYCGCSAGFFKCSVCGKEEEGIFKDVDSGPEVDEFRNGEPWICFSCRK